MIDGWFRNLETDLPCATSSLDTACLKLAHTVALAEALPSQFSLSSATLGHLLRNAPATSEFDLLRTSKDYINLRRNAYAAIMKQGHEMSRACKLCLQNVQAMQQQSVEIRETALMVLGAM